MASSATKVGNLKGAPGPASWATPPAAWIANTSYSASAPASLVTNSGGTYVCSTTHTSGSSFDATKFTLIAASGAPGSPGARGAAVFSGSGAPSSAIISNAVAGQDSYIDIVAGDTYSFS